jgi:hypothetical protein
MKVARLNGWDYHTTGLQLGTSLVGNAAAVLSTLTQEQSDDLRCLVQALLAKHCPVGREAQYSFELMTRNKREKESMTDFAEALTKLARKSYPSTGVPERILIDLFKRGLPSQTTQLQVHLKNPRSLSEAVEVAVACETFERNNSLGNGKKPKGEIVAMVASEGGKVSQAKKGPVQQKDTPSSNDAKTDDSTWDEDLKREFLGWRERRMKDRQSEIEGNRCFYCKEAGHFKTNCQKLRDRMEREKAQGGGRDKSPLN